MKHLLSPISIILLFCFIDLHVNAQTVKTESGLLSGITCESGVKVFKGIPFAAPPIGELRWKEPQPPLPWDGIRKCDTFGPSAMQGAPVPFNVWTKEFLIPDEPVSEDCLYLNIWTDAVSSGEKRPVIVFIHGGAFWAGSGSVPIYNGESMAKKGIVFVTINYRLGLFGFFTHPELTKEAGHGTGNFAILDQILALKWVKNNISQFGGDPGNVTIAGQSAGSMSVNVLAASPLARGLFHKIIAQSGAFVLSDGDRTAITLDDAEDMGTRTAAMVHANSLNELRKVPAEELQKTLKNIPSVIIDNYVLPKSIPEIFAEGEQAYVPLLTGWNEDDVLWAEPVTADEFKAEMKKQFGSEAENVLKFYPASSNEEAFQSNREIGRDMFFGIQNYSWARMQSEKNNTYLYYFSRKVPATADFIKYGAFHSAEITYAYDNLKFQPDRPFVKADYDLANVMSSYWANFAKNGDPNGEGLPEWHAFSKTNGETMILDINPHAAKHPKYDALEYFYKMRTGNSD